MASVETTTRPEARQETKSRPGDALDLHVEGMHCASSVSRVERAISEVPGVAEASVNLGSECAHVVFSGRADAGAVTQAIEEAGYGVEASSIELGIEGMTCASCVRRVERALGKVFGVPGVDINLANASARVSGFGLDTGALVAAVRKAGYGAFARQDEAEAEADARQMREARREWLTLGAASLLSAPLLIMMILRLGVSRPGCRAGLIWFWRRRCSS